MDFEKICMMFTMQEPYYGILLSSMERIETDKIKTMAVGRYGNVFKLMYNPSFVSQLDVDTTLEALKHEVLHVAFDHFNLWEVTDVDDDEQFLRNAAADMEVNGYLNIANFHDIKPVLASSMGWEDKLGTREYYDRLNQANQQKQQQAQAQQPQMPCNGGKGGQQGQPQPSQGNQPQQPDNSNNQGQNQPQQGDNPQPNQGNGIDKELEQKLQGFDDHSQWPQCESEAEREMIRQAVEDMIVFAAEEVEKSCGTVPEEMKIRVDAIRKRKPKPVADWKRYFRRYLGNEFTELIRKSKKRESRRFPDAAGNRHQRKSHILVGIDTSGSVSMPEYNEFFGQIGTLTASATFHVIECDSTIHYEYDFKGRPNQDLHGGGGTSFQPVVDEFIKNRKKYDALVYFTDGYAPIPRNTPKETLWVISSHGDKDRQKYKVNNASVVFIPKKEQ